MFARVRLAILNIEARKLVWVLVILGFLDILFVGRLSGLMTLMAILTAYLLVSGLGVELLLDKLRLMIIEAEFDGGVARFDRRQRQEVPLNDDSRNALPAVQKADESEHVESLSILQFQVSVRRRAGWLTDATSFQRHCSPRRSTSLAMPKLMPMTINHCEFAAFFAPRI